MAELKLNWEDFIRAALTTLNVNFKVTDQCRFVRDHGPYNGGEGEAYDLPEAVYIKLEE